MPAKSTTTYHITIKSRDQAKAINRLYRALRKSFDRERETNDPTLKRYEIHQRLIERGLSHSDTQKEVAELVKDGILPPSGLN